MRFLFVDRILAIEPGKSVRGVKHVTADDDFLGKGPHGQVALLTSIVAEAMGQCCAWSVMAATEFRLRPVAGLIGEVGIRGDAVPGDVILLDATIDAMDEDRVVYQAKATVRGQLIGTLTDALGPLLPVETFIDPDEARAQFELIRRPGPLSDLSDTKPHPALSREAPPPSLEFDRILSRETGAWRSPASAW